jgi:hypothetical protein
MVLIGKPSDTAEFLRRGVDDRISTLTSHLPKQRVLKFAHLAMPFSPKIFFYGRGKSGSCDDYKPGTSYFVLCNSKTEFYFTNAREDDESPLYFRLTFNPYFDELSSQIGMFLNTAGDKN